MSVFAPVTAVTPTRIKPPHRLVGVQEYVEVIGQITRLERLLLDIIKDEFERRGQTGITPVQALLLFNLGEAEVTVGELKSRGFYQGSNVSYNLRKLVRLGYLHHARSESDKRSVKISLTTKGRDVRGILQNLFASHIDGQASRRLPRTEGLAKATEMMGVIEKFWRQQIRYIY